MRRNGKTGGRFEAIARHGAGLERVMSIGATTIREVKLSSFGQVPASLWLGVGLYVFLLFASSGLLNDSDTYWQIAVGQWILDRGAMPHVDVYSFSMPGETWVSSSWLAQVLYAASYDVAGWAGPVVVAAGGIAATFALLVHILERRLPPTYAVLIALAAVVLSMPHFLARPHVLAMPLMVAWAHGLMTASERRQPPSLWLLPLIALWANLHGGFVFGLVLAAAFAIDALWNAKPSQRRPLALRWAAFGLAALVACCVTPYGWGSILALIAGALYRGIKLSPPRIALVLGLLHMALSHGRNLEIFALLLPIVVLTPVSQQLGLQPDRPGRVTFVSAAVLAAALAISTWTAATHGTYSPPRNQSPAAAVEAVKAHHLRRVFNDRAFGGYLIWRQMPVFIDGRAELYGEKFTMAYYDALERNDIGRFLGLLEEYNIDGLLLRPGTPTVGLIDHLGVWRRVYADDVSVLYVRGGADR